MLKHCAVGLSSVQRGEGGSCDESGVGDEHINMICGGNLPPHLVHSKCSNLGTFLSQSLFQSQKSRQLINLLNEESIYQVPGSFIFSPSTPVSSSLLRLAAKLADPTSQPKLKHQVTQHLFSPAPDPIRIRGSGSLDIWCCSVVLSSYVGEMANSQHLIRLVSGIRW